MLQLHLVARTQMPQLSKMKFYRRDIKNRWKSFNFSNFKIKYFWTRVSLAAFAFARPNVVAAFAFEQPNGVAAFSRHHDDISLLLLDSNPPWFLYYIILNLMVYFLTLPCSSSAFWIVCFSNSRVSIISWIWLAAQKGCPPLHESVNYKTKSSLCR
jgi:hypothetical protein